MKSPFIIANMKKFKDNKDSLSMEEKMNLVYELACHIGYSDGQMHVRKERYEESDLVWSFIDGLYQKWLYDTINGNCSLKQSLEFNLEAEEKDLDGYIEKFELILDKLD